MKEVIFNISIWDTQDSKNISVDEPTVFLFKQRYVLKDNTVATAVHFAEEYAREQLERLEMETKISTLAMKITSV